MIYSIQDISLKHVWFISVTSSDLQQNLVHDGRLYKTWAFT